MPNLYSGHWPSNVKKDAKYIVKQIGEEPRVTVQYEFDDGLKYLAVEAGQTEYIVEKVNAIKKLAGGRNGPFYINEYKHLIVPVKIDNSTHYYFAGKVNVNFKFTFEDKMLTTKPIDVNGNEMVPGALWHGPRPGIPYVIVANGQNIRYKTPALTDTDPQKVRKNCTQEVKLSDYHSDSIVKDVIEPILKGKSGESGRFYVNEHRALFAPNRSHDDEFIYCGQLDLNHWFPEPEV